MRKITLLVTLFLAAAALAKPPQVTTVVIVRHAEKAVAAAGASGDVALSDAGHARARELARLLAPAGVTAIYDTQFLRTQQTVEPLAAAAHLTPVVVQATPTYAKDLARTIKTTNGGGTVVVASHSNLVPELLRELGVAAPPAIADTQFDDLFIVTLVDGAPPRLLAMRYGAVAR
jgi:2,3-bisphosphoglycerate-dependent phosphoglycerate mutase